MKQYSFFQVLGEMFFSNLFVLENILKVGRTGRADLAYIPLLFSKALPARSSLC